MCQPPGVVPQLRLARRADAARHAVTRYFGAMRAHFILYVRDQHASTTFYRHVLGTAPTLDVPGGTEFALSGDAVLGLMPEAGIARLLDGQFSAPAPGTCRAELYLVVPDPAAFHARALAAGARELSPLAGRDWGAEVAYSVDLDGCVLAFGCPSVLPSTDTSPR